MRRVIAIACLLAASGCGTRSLLLMKPLPPTYAWQRDATGPGSVTGSVTGSGSGSVTGSGSGSGSVTGSGSGSDSASGSLTASGSPTGSGSLTGPAASALGLVLSRLPAPHRAPRTKEPAPTPASLAAARALIGVRDPRTSLAFALAVTAGLHRPRALPDVGDGPALVAWARAHDALAPITPGADDVPAIEAGDLLVFDRAAGGKPASLVAVALGRDPRGVIELLYLAGGVIRVGHVDPTRPRLARDRERKVVNTYLRHGADQPPAGTRFLAGELISARIRLR